MKRPIGRRESADTASLWELLNLGTPDETAWMADAVCAQTDPDAFFPDKGQSGRAAKTVCAVCPVRTECAAYAMKHDERFGVWGGLTESDRRKQRRAARIHEPGHTMGRGMTTSTQPMITRPGGYSAKNTRRVGAPNHLQGSGENPMVGNSPQDARLSTLDSEGEVA